MRVFLLALDVLFHNVDFFVWIEQVLHYIPACERKDKEPPTKVPEETLHKTQHVDGKSQSSSILKMYL